MLVRCRVKSIGKEPTCTPMPQCPDAPMPQCTNAQIPQWMSVGMRCANLWEVRLKLRVPGEQRRSVATAKCAQERNSRERRKYVCTRRQHPRSILTISYFTLYRGYRDPNCDCSWYQLPATADRLLTDFLISIINHHFINRLCLCLCLLLFPRVKDFKFRTCPLSLFPAWGGHALTLTRNNGSLIGSRPVCWLSGYVVHTSGSSPRSCWLVPAWFHPSDV